MKRNWFVKLLCVNLAVCMAMPNLSFMQAAMNAGQVYAAELETESEIITEEVKEVETKETEVTQVSETETTNAEETENEEIKMTQVS